MIPDDIALLRTPGRPAVLPDGSAAVVAVTAPDLEADEATGGLWLVPLHGDAVPRRLTTGHRDTEPAVTPDGGAVVFVRASPGVPGQAFLLPLAGGDAVRLTDAPLGVQAPAVSPDGRRLAVLARIPERGRYERDGDPGAEPPRLVDRYRYRADALGFLHDRPRHALVVDLPGVAADATLAAVDPRPAPALDVTPGDHEVRSLAWDAAGTALLVVTAVHTARDEDLRTDVVRVPVPAVLPVPVPAGRRDPAPGRDGARAPATAGDRDAADAAAADGPAGTVVPAPGGTAGWARLTDADAGSTLAVDAVRPAPDGLSLWLLGSETGPTGRDFVGRATGLLRLPLGADGAPAGPPERLTDEDVDLDPEVLVPRGGAVLVARVHRGAQPLLEVAADGTRREVLVGLDPSVGGGPAVVTAAAAAGDVVVVSAAGPATAGDVLVVDPAGGEARAVTDLSGPLRATGRLRRAEELTAHAPDGTAVHGWTVRPDPALHGPGPYPTLLMIHGGPHAQYTGAVFDEAQVLAHAGYAVVMGNPRGSAGYGRAHALAIRQAMGTVDTDDVLALLDAALTADDLDEARTGALGGSYGGYLTAWLTTRTQRFAAAVVERGFLDPVSFVGSSDIGWFFGLEYVGDAATPEGAALVAAQSPMAHVGAVRTPTLVVHSEHDWRCPVEQGQRWFVELRRRGVPTRLLLFPGEGHELTRSGRPSHRVARFAHLLRWWDEHLPVRVPTDGDRDVDGEADGAGGADGADLVAPGHGPAGATAG
ncbi:S9 family peptidase [Cellulomonas endophytica]|uniref:S9 family peptidase n=1 Tax=Cellulomonas endophytica TaxID=2494735 RepID=UPI001012E884|nr:alpha/beta fold hydrolase [Cellulomonas endophytica]